MRLSTRPAKAGVKIHVLAMRKTVDSLGTEQYEIGRHIAK
ncbi:hypothetical protein GWI33_011580, partial [Rhynchophorus ferrugineus]